MRPFASFWRQAFALEGSATPLVMPHVVAFGAVAAVVSAAAWAVERVFQQSLALAVAPYEVAGAVLGLLLVLRTNAGYDRWWEARKLWGGIVNQSRNLAAHGLAYGPADTDWRRRFVAWTAAFGHAARASLRGERDCPEVAALVGPDDGRRVAAADHAPSYVALRLAGLLREACAAHDMDRFAFAEADRQRAALIDHVGACERILKTPLPTAYSIIIRRFLVVFLVTLPFGLLDEVPSHWLIPFITVLVAYPVVALDQIGIELQNPFSKAKLNSLPLDDITATIERNLTGLLADAGRDSRGDFPAPAAGTVS